MMSSVIYRIIKRPDVVDDLIQDCIILALGARQNFKGEAAVRTWVYMIAKNRALMWRRTELLKLTGQTKTCGIEALSIDWTDPRFHAGRCYRPDKVYEDTEVIERFINMTDELSPKLRIVARLRILADMTYREIANELQVPESAAKARMHKARQKLAGQRHAFA